MERSVREFLKEIGAESLKDRGVLTRHRRYNYLLQGVGVKPLVGLMREKGVSKLVSHDGKWFLAADGAFRNPKSTEKKGAVDHLTRLGNVFLGQNAYINPYFQWSEEDPATRYISSNLQPFARITINREEMGGQPCVRNMPIAAATIVEMIAEGQSFDEVLHSYPCLEAEDIKEALGYAAKKVSQVNTYIFRLDIEQEEDGRWSADIPVLTGCAVWGYTKQETLDCLRDVAQDFVEVIEEWEELLPEEALQESRSLSEQVVTVTL